MPVPGPLELIIVLVIALIVLGPGKLPDVGAALGKGIREFRKASADIQDAARVEPAQPATQPPPPPVAAPAAPPPAAPVTSAAPAEPTAQPKP